jgi:site-specific recombinase XerD
MNDQITNFDKLISDAANYMEIELSYSMVTIKNHKRNWEKIKKIMSKKGIEKYNQSVGEQIIYQKFAGRVQNSYSPQEKYFCTSVRMLTEFLKNGKICISPRRKEELVFEGKLGTIISEFVSYKKNEERLSQITIHSYQRSLFKFLEYCNKYKIQDVSNIDLKIIFHFIKELVSTEKIYVNLVIMSLRGFMKYIYVKKYSQTDYSGKIPKYKIVNQPNLPSTYSKDEMETLLSSMERNSTLGKRNYAIVLMIVRLGLRASDVSNLKFENLYWETSEIKIEQFKTGQKLVLPLLPDVGNAIIDYLRYGRPQSKESFVFLMERPPYGHFVTSNTVTLVVQRAILNAGISVKGRKFGPHALRHSLSLRMLDEGTAYPVISEVLGHKNSQSTLYYLRVDMKSMKQCMLDVSPVSESFYLQKGGVFYE